MAEQLRCSTRIHKILRCIIIHEMTLNNSFTANLSRMTHSYSASASSVSTLDGRGAGAAVRRKKKTVETGCTWILIITAAGPNEQSAYGRLLLLILLLKPSIVFVVLST